MIKKVLVTLLVTVDDEDEEICPIGDPLIENVVLNHLDDGFIDPVEEQINYSKEIGFKFIELHTGKYAELCGDYQYEELQKIIECS